MKRSLFDYPLPADRIAQKPLDERDRCRLMVVDRTARAFTHTTFDRVAGLLQEGDCLVLNDTRVVPARLFGRRKTGGKVEVFVVEYEGRNGEALVRPSTRLKEGERITLESGNVLEVGRPAAVGRAIHCDDAIGRVLERCGHMPLPPYIRRTDTAADREDYQTVYARRAGATASPTAGLHFTAPLLERIRVRGVTVTYVTLHTNYGTFAPITADEVEDHRMHRERFELPAETARAVRAAKERGRKVVAVGTTSARVLEHCGLRDDGMSGSTGLYIFPGYRFSVVDRLITNFHLPHSTLLVLAAAFTGRELILDAYREAVAQGYRFFSYGDAMFIT